MSFSRELSRLREKFRLVWRGFPKPLSLLVQFQSCDSGATISLHQIFHYIHSQNNQSDGRDKHIEYIQMFSRQFPPNAESSGFGATLLILWRIASR
jgi:hypothetical protein